METIPVLNFIARLTLHIPEKHFKIIRYYGIYARHRKLDQYLRRAISREKHKIYLSFNRWRDSTLHFFGYNPLKCPNCGNTMLFLELYFNHKPVSLHELYERTMKKSHCRSPAHKASFYSYSVCDKLKRKRRIPYHESTCRETQKKVHAHPAGGNDFRRCP